jgi:hypothetical protein
VWINTDNFGDVALPFGSYKESVGDVRWARKCLNSTPRPKRSPPRYDLSQQDRCGQKLDGVGLPPDASRLTLLLRDTAGQKLSFSLPTNCLDSHATSPIIVASQDQPSANRHPSRRVALQMREQHCADAFRNLVGGIMPDTR